VRHSAFLLTGPVRRQSAQSQRWLRWVSQRRRRSSSIGCGSGRRRFVPGLSVLERAMEHLFWLSDEAWAAIEPHLPKNQPGARRVDDRRVISGIIHVLKTGGRWRDCPKDYGPHTTIYNRFNRWSRRALWRRILDALVDKGALVHATSIDSTYVRAHRSAHGGKGGRRRRPSVLHGVARPPKSMSSRTCSADP
jgi:transposase